MSRHSFCILHSAFCIFGVAVAAMAATATPDQSVKVVADAAPPQKAEPIMYWWGWNKRKVFSPPEGEPAPRLWARASFATNHPAEGVVAFCCEARGDYMPNQLTFFLDAGGMTKAHEYWKRGRKDWNPLRPGEKGQWTDISSALNYGYRNIFLAAPRDNSGRHTMPGDAIPAFTVEFSRDGTNIVGAISSGGGPVACGLVSLARGIVESDAQLSAADLARARAAGASEPKRPRRFTVRLCHALSASSMSGESFSNEVEVIRLLGVNDAGRAMADIIDPKREFEPEHLWRSPPGDMIGSRTHGCICSPKFSSITNALGQLKRNAAGPLSRGRTLIVGIMDEPHYGVQLATNCTSTLAETKHRVEAAARTIDPGNPDSVLAAVAARDALVADYYRTFSRGGEAVGLTNVLFDSNVGISLVFSGNAYEPGTSPFFMADNGLVGILQTEDWSNLQRTRQFCSYISDVYRAAASRNGLDVAMYLILNSAPETAAKAFSEIGHGVQAISLFCYGPHWLRGDHRNQNPAIYGAIRAICEALAEAEDPILDGKVARGDAALFFSESGDKLEIIPGMKRDWIERNPFGKDRMSVSLMLAHCGVRTDVLDEKAVRSELPRYRVLFAADRCLRRDAAEAIGAWLRNGGILVRTSGALSCDERGAPLPDEIFPKEAKVVELDFSPWRDYVKPAKKVGDGCESHRVFDEAVRAKMADAVREAGIDRRVFTDVPLVEASLIEGGGARVVSLANWSAEPRRRVKVALNGVGEVRDVRSALGAPVEWRQSNGSLAVSLEIGWGDFLIVEPVAR